MPTIDTSLIEHRPGVVGGKAVVRGTRVPVWIVVEYWRIFEQDLDRFVANYPTAGEAGLWAALAYYDSHRAEIDAQITANDDIDALITENEPVG